MLCRFQQLRSVADDAGYTIEDLLGLIPKLTAENSKRKLKVTQQTQPVEEGTPPEPEPEPEPAPKWDKGAIVDIEVRCA